MSAPTKKAPAKKTTVKRSPRAAKLAPPAADEPELTDEELAAAAAALAGEERQGPIGEDGEIRPVMIGRRGRKGDTAKVEMTTVFHLDDVDYQVPKEPSVALVLRFMRDLGTFGRDAAIERMAFTLLGERALEALAASPEVEPADVADVFTIIGAIFFGSEIYKQFRAATDPS